MNIDKVIKLGDSIKLEELGFFSQFTSTTWIWVVGLIAVAILFLIIAFLADAEQLLSVSFALFVASTALILWYGVVMTGSKEIELYNKDIQNWKEEVALPYIQSLEKEQKEIVYIKIDPEMSSKTNGFMFLGSGYVDSVNTEKTPVVVSYKDNGIVTRTDWVPTRMELTENETPFIEFQNLKEDLGHDLNAGIYNPQIFLPESYTFTEIK